MSQRMQRTSGILDNAVAEAITFTNMMKRKWAKGLLLRKELDAALFEQASRLEGLLRGAGLLLKLRQRKGLPDLVEPFCTKALFESFLAEYQAWQRGNPPASAAGQTWLIHASGTEQVQAADKVQVLALIAASLYPFEFLEPRDCPPQVPNPYLTNLHTWCDSQAMAIHCGVLDDPGFAKWSRPDGRQHKLSLQNGAQAVLWVVGTEGDQAEKKCLLMCQGFIEGYMDTSFDREIELLIEHGIITGFYFRWYRKLKEPGMEQTVNAQARTADIDVYNRHPLWASYRNWIQDDHRAKAYQQRLERWLQE